MTHAQCWDSFREAKAHFDRFPSVDNGAVVTATYRAWVESADLPADEAAGLCRRYEHVISAQLAKLAA